MIARLSLWTALLCGAASAPSVAGAAPPAVEVLDAGKGKKEAIILAPKAGDTVRQTLDLELQQEMSSFGTVVMPGMRLTSVDRIEEVRPDGSFVATAEVVSADWYEVAGSTLSVDDVRAQSPAELVGTRQRVEVDRFGRVTSLTEDGGKVPSPAAGVSDGVVWPEVPVGVGASWRVVSELESGGVRAVQSVTYTLVSRRRDEVVVDAVVTQTADPQQISNQGMTFDVVAFSGEGSGRVTLDLGRRIPITSTFDLAVTVGLAPVAQDGERPVLPAMQATSRVKLRSAQVP